MSLNATPYKVGDIIDWGYDSCYECEGYCGHSVATYTKRPATVLEVKWGEHKYFSEYIPDWVYLLKLVKRRGEVHEEWVPHWRLR